MNRYVLRGLLVISALALSLLTGCKHRIPPPNLDPEATTILCVGDSITAGTHGVGDSGSLSYPSLLSGMLQKSPMNVQVVNEGQNGWNINDVSQHIANWLEPINPKVILLQIGTNDLEQGINPEDSASRLDDLITRIETLAPETHLYVASTTPMRPDNKPGLPLATLEQFNGYIPYVIHLHERKHHFLVFVDLYKRAGMVGSDLGPDGEHPDDAGYTKMADFWFKTLVKHEAAFLR